MTKELKKRIITSIILFLLLIFCIFVNKYFFIFSVFIVSYIVWNEISKITFNIVGKLNLKDFLIKLFTLYYVFGIFAFSTIALKELSGSFYFFYIFCICISSDVGGYIVGKKIGGKKLTKISPNKTISGSIGSLFFSLAPLIIFNYFFENQYLLIIDNILFCILISLITQSGDIFISYLKRKGNVKDTGNLLPGHGGMLDRIDGIIFAIPFSFIITHGFAFFSYPIILIKFFS